MKPKLISWSASCSGSGCVARLEEEPLAQLAERQVGGVDHDVRVVANGLEQPALGRDRGRNPPLVAQRMAMAGLGVAPDQDLVASLEEEHLRPDPAPFERAAHGRQRNRDVAAAHVQYHRDAREPLGVVGDQRRELRQHLARQVVHAGVPEILEQLGGRGLPGARDPGHDDHVLVDRGLLLGRGKRRRGLGGRLGRTARFGTGGGRQRPPAFTRMIESS